MSSEQEAYLVSSCMQQHDCRSCRWVDDCWSVLHDALRDLIQEAKGESA